MDIDGKMYDSKGKEMVCGKCGKPASGGIFGKEAFMIWCSEHDPNKSSFETQFVYRTECRTEYGSCCPIRFPTSKEK